MSNIEKWPFQETPAVFAIRMMCALKEFDGDMLAAVRHCLIENPAHLANSGNGEGKERPEKISVRRNGDYAVRLIRSAQGVCTVDLEIGGEWVEVIRDAGSIISHIVEPSGIAAALPQSARLGKG